MTRKHIFQKIMYCTFWILLVYILDPTPLSLSHSLPLAEHYNRIQPLKEQGPCSSLRFLVCFLFLSVYGWQACFSFRSLCFWPSVTIVCCSNVSGSCRYASRMFHLLVSMLLVCFLFPCVSGVLLVPLCMLLVCFLLPSMCFWYVSSSCLRALGVLPVSLCMFLECF